MRLDKREGSPSLAREMVSKFISEAGEREKREARK
jgi:hypothetical protein